MVKFLFHKIMFGGAESGLRVKSFFTAKNVGFAKNYFMVSMTLAANNLF